MDEKELERRLTELRESWRVAPEPPLDRMWMRIEGEAFTRGTPGRWLRKLLPLAATLLGGIGPGRGAPPPPRPRAAPAMPAATARESTPESGTPARLVGNEPPFVGVATDYLERVTALLVTLDRKSTRLNSSH